VANPAVISERVNAPDATRPALCKFMADAKTRITRASPLAAMFAQNPDDIPSATLIRHAIEMAQSENLFRPLDAMAYCLLIDAGSPVARLWGAHTLSADDRESVAMRYLRNAGLGTSAIAGMPMLTNTLRRRRFVEWATGLHGPLPILLNVLWMDRNPDLGSGIYLERPDSIDETRAEGILEVVVNVVNDKRALNAAEQLIDSIADFSSMYFSELDAVCGNVSHRDRESMTAKAGWPAL
jgi:hypothetical protein